MRFPDRPIATAGLAIACALILLGILSYPTFIGTTSRMTEAIPSSSGQSSTTVQYVASATPGESSVSSSVVATEASATAAQSSSTSSGETGPNNATVVQSGTTVTVASSVTVGATTITLVTTIASSSAPLAASSSSSQSQQHDQVIYAGPFGTSANTAQILYAIAALSIVSLAIAAGSMLFVSRRVNSEEDAET